MSDMVIRGFESKVKHNQRCTGCGGIIGPDAPVKVGFEVRDGDVTGLFHSRACYEEQRRKFEEYKEKGGDNA